MVYLGSDHAGFVLKEELKKYLHERGFKYVDLGCFSDDPVDYPDVAREVAEKVAEDAAEDVKGVLVCGTGLGMCMAANKVKGIRAASMVNENMAEMARRHNNANIACLGGKMVTLEEAKKLLDVFLNTGFDADERHVRRIGKIEG